MSTGTLPPATTLRPLQDDDRVWAARFIRERWGSQYVVSRGRVHTADTLPGLAALRDGEPVGLLTYHVHEAACEIVTIDSRYEGQGIGSMLLRSMSAVARTHGCKRLWLVTTNDNTTALRFYQKRGFRLCALHVNAVEIARTLKPQIPLTGLDGITIRDELELEIIL